MKEQLLEDLAKEMITEIKDLKDLTKNELPEIAKEYVRYQIIAHLASTVIFGLLAIILACIGVFAGVIHVERESTTELIRFCAFMTSFCTLIATIIALNELMSVWLQPRRTAIKAITSLLK